MKEGENKIDGRKRKIKGTKRLNKVGGEIRKMKGKKKETLKQKWKEENQGEK